MKQEVADLIKDIMSMNCETYTVFVRFSGHVNEVEFTAHNTGWVSGSDPTIRDSFYLGSYSPKDIKRIKSAFSADLERGKKLLNNEKLIKQQRIEQLKNSFHNWRLDNENNPRATSKTPRHHPFVS